ncbi:uncharacterized protein LOC106640102 isoform X2 [Copidosoma floridanum]|uniref:uncharacterized protein LOC106640102 isoform X2 n=1 Tax=Copidosoma floridanum TaxID=29053 RepID=UPI0006C97ACD|nr:uncharacterized protein LOC106640102 isoform X2 [Copidosoma floridanum]
MAEDELDERSSGRRKSSYASNPAASESGTLAVDGASSNGSEVPGTPASGVKGVLGGVLPPEEVENFKVKAKWYTSMCLGTTAILSVFAFLFAIPFVVEPAISTILADFSPKPITCATTSHVLAEGLRNCSWSSCREGCTAAVTSCHQIRVNYTKILYEEFLTRPAGVDIDWDMNDTKFFVNAEGCGYPDTGVVCSIFAEKYGRDSYGTVFPCYYSRTYPETVVSRYSWDDTLRNLILAITIPILLFLLSLGVLCYWYCPPVNKHCGGSRSLIDKYERKEE